MNNRVDNLTGFERDMLIHWFMYKMPMDQRYELMEDLPKIYFKLTGVKPVIWKETTKENNND